MTKNLPAAIPEVISRYLKGELIKDLAKEHGVARQTIYNWMLAGLGDKDYPQEITNALVRRIADADEALDSAANSLDLARAREQCRFARMDLERRRPELYGAKQEVRHVTPEPLRIITVVATAQQIAPQHDNKGLTIDAGTQQVIDNK